MTLTVLNIVGLCLNLIGSFILAASLGLYISSLRSAIDRLEMYVKSYMSMETRPSPITGKNIHFTNERKWPVYFTWLGVAFIATGYAIQLFVFVFCA